ncbi:MAG: L-serine ammonia-lyase, iron-sulfur-dependent subunit beta [Oscillospiraceae bacterium]|nr:L-serine ammonia-lyase, iron-sulfur-dependent subunit beta [Oscillospiraceae bacterium]
MNLFDIMGPVMVGPSSSHTAGAVRIGNMARCLLGDTPVRADIGLCGSFADTGRGHGTDRALIAGILGMQSDDRRIPNSFVAAEAAGLDYTIHDAVSRGAHPNTACVLLTGKSGREINMQASSLGGGRIMVNKLEGIEVNFTGEYNTLIVHNLDLPGNISDVSYFLARRSINIANLHLYRDRRGGQAVTVVELDEEIPADVLHAIGQIDSVLKLTYYQKEAR